MSITEKLNKIKSCKEDIKQAIIDKGVDMTDVSLEGYATKISEIQTGGGDFLDMKANLSTYYSTVESIPAYAFAYMRGLTSVNLPNCVSISAGVFTNCTSLQSVNIPMCERVGSSAFAYCSSLQSIDLPNCSYVSTFAFSYCTSLQSVNLPNCGIVDNYAFAYCSSLQSINLPMCSYVSNSPFSYCSSLQSVNLPICYNVGNYAFNNCSSLSTLDLRSTYSCSLPYSNAFSRTPFASGIGSIYVHAAHLSQFQNATNWTYFSKCFVGVGDPDRPLLAFDNGRVYGDTFVLNVGWNSYLGITSSSVISINLPNVEGLFTNNYFTKFYNLTEVSMEKLTSAPDRMCSYCSSLQSINLPMCSYVGEGAFYSCSSLQSINLPMCSYVGEGAFYSCSSLQSINLPMCSRVLVDGFRGCSSLQSINLPMCSYVGNYAFAFCSSLSTIYIGTSISTVCEIAYSTFSNTNSSFSIFVPMSLVDSYKTTEHWSKYASQILGV